MADFTLPMQGQQFQPIDPSANAAKAFTMASSIKGIEDIQRDRSDETAVREYIKNGGDFVTPEGVSKAIVDLQGRVSPHSYKDLATYRDSLAQRHVALQAQMQKLTDEQLTGILTKNTIAEKAFAPLVAQYREEAAVNPQLALENYTARKQAVAQLLSQPGPDGQPLMGPDQVEQFTQATPEFLQTRINQAGWWNEQLKKAAEAKRAEAQANYWEQGGASPIANCRDMATDEAGNFDQARFDQCMAQVKASKSGQGALGESDIESAARSIVAYDQPPIIGYRATTPNGAAIMTRVRELDPDYDATQYENKRRAVAAFGSGPLGTQVRSFNAALAHIDLLREYAYALNNNDTKALNLVGNEIEKQLGVSAPTTFNGLKLLVSEETTKAVAGMRTGQKERLALDESLNTSLSPGQIVDTLRGYERLMVGQLDALKQQFTDSTKLPDAAFYNKLLPRSREVFEKFHPKLKTPRGKVDVGVPVPVAPAPEEIQTMRGTTEQVNTIPQGQAWKTADDVYLAVTKGKLSKAEARAILQDMIKNPAVPWPKPAEPTKP